MAGNGKYTISLDAIMNDSKVRAQIAALQADVNKGAIGAAGNVKGGKSATAVMSQTAKGAKQATKEVNKMSKGLSVAGINILDVGKKVAAFGAVTSVIQGVGSGISSVVQNVTDLDAALTEYKKVSDLSEKGLQSMTESAYKMGKSVAKTGVEMVESATEFKKAGFSDKDALKLGKVAMLYTNIADVELSAGDAANFITSQMKAFNLTASDSEHIVDAVNAVSNNFAVSSADIATNIGKASAAMATGNVTYEQSIGLTK